ncbi:hypothetical protein F3F38_21750 [Bacteroides ovatus]|nr:hypothetical protein F3F38_21750 [Bacteroides ovatus]
MKKRNYTLTTALTAALCCLICLLNGCTRDNDIDIPQTSVNTMGATTVQPGETITLTGDNMHLISKVYFGDVTTLDIKTPQADRDHQSLTVYVPTEVFEETKAVSLAVLYNSVHRLVVCEELTVYIAPVIPTTSTTLSGEVKPGDIITIAGTNLNIIKAIQANGESVTIDNKKATEITFKAPEVDADTEFTVTLIYGKSDKETASIGTVKVKKATVVLTYLYWENITLGAPATECALFDASAGRTITPCDLFDNQANVDFAMDATSSAAARLLNPANINDNFMKAQICGDSPLSSDGKDYSTVRTSLKTQFKLLNSGNETENTLIQKVLNGEITDIKEDIGSLNPSTNTPTVTENDVLVFKNTNKNKMGIIRIKSVTLGEKKELNTITMDVYYEK